MKEEGYDAAHARHGAEALVILSRRRSFCAILLDMRMPVMGGVEFRRAQLRDSKISSIPVVAFSADARDREEALAADVSAAGGGTTIASLPPPWTIRRLGFLAGGCSSSKTTPTFARASRTCCGMPVSRWRSRKMGSSR
ncbi:MAG: response regulator [Acidobacteria bacterium]|nr:response regulator [Acidobacteriota bacterium]